MIGGQKIEIGYQNARDLINTLRTSIQNGAIFETVVENHRILINTKNITTIELVRENTSSLDTFKGYMPVGPQTAEELREAQLAMQPDILKFEAKAKAMEKLKEVEEKQRVDRIKQIYGDK